jgi:2-oxoglutarate ferredoxin oxidoreductase subunit beta
MHDGSRLVLKKVAADYDPTEKMAALKLIRESEQRGEFATGILYIEPGKHDFTTLLNLVDEPLATLPLERLRPGREVLDSIMEALK